MLSEKLCAEILKNFPKERLAIGFSGGGDSTALVHLCRNLSPHPLILIVDHALRAGSENEAQAARSFAESLGLEAQILSWEHNNVTSGLQKKARRARYTLMGQACRNAGIRHLLTAHTADDQAETLWMRYKKNTGWRGAAGMAISTYAPVWPGLAEVILHRPLLNVFREDLRAYNRRHRLNWIEDPSNSNLAFERIRAREYLGHRPAKAQFLRNTAKELRRGLRYENQRLSGIHYDVDDFGLVYTPRNIPRQFLKFCLLAAGGRGRTASIASLKKFHELIRSDKFRSGTFLGSLCIVQSNRLVFGPDPDQFKGRSNRPVRPDEYVKRGTSAIWNGRFNVVANRDLKISSSLGSHNEYAFPELKEAFRKIPAQFRGSIPVFTGSNDSLLGFGQMKTRDFYSNCLISKRMEGFLRQNDR